MKMPIKIIHIQAQMPALFHKVTLVIYHKGREIICPNPNSMDLKTICVASMHNFNQTISLDSYLYTTIIRICSRHTTTTSAIRCLSNLNIALPKTPDLISLAVVIHLATKVLVIKAPITRIHHLTILNNLKSAFMPHLYHLIPRLLFKKLYLTL
jgi:hypothetical protein